VSQSNVIEVFQNTCQVRLRELMIIVSKLDKAPKSDDEAIKSVKTTMSKLVRATSGRKDIKARFEPMRVVAFTRTELPDVTLFAEVSAPTPKRAREIVLEGVGLSMWWYKHKQWWKK